MGRKSPNLSGPQVLGMPDSWSPRLRLREGCLEEIGITLKKGASLKPHRSEAQWLLWVVVTSTEG